MADLTITAANVALLTGTTGDGTANATITAGQLLYLETAPSTYNLVDNDAEGTAVIAGVALHGASSGQPIKFQKTGTYTTGSVSTIVGEVYCASGNAGGIAPDADVIAADYRSIWGIGTLGTVITIGIQNSGVQVP